ncbi:glycosyltransferase, partial [Candidatus Microgenomates bacterium]|nr:glycosyltransferase [Candidatus Microgenomates bacterium]
MKASIIIVNYNGKEFIGECINSVLASNYYQDFEIIVVDNASTDGSVEFINQLTSLRVNELKNNKVIIRLIKSQRNLYFTGGSNLGAEKAKGEKLIFLNSDTVVDKNFIKELVKFAQKNKKYLVQPKILFHNNPSVIDNVGGHYNFFGFGFAVGRGKKDNGQYNKNAKFDYVNGTAFLIDRQFFLGLGGFDNRFRYFYEDVDLSLRARKQGGECWSCWHAVIYHQGSLTFKKTLTVKEIRKRIRKNRQLLRVKRLNQNIKIITNKLRLWELKKTIQKKEFSLLDLGCGDGDFAILAANEVIKVIGVDKKLPFSTTLCRAVENLEFKKKNINHLIFKERFEIITMYHVLEHLNQPEKVLKKIKDLLKPKGFLVLEVPLVGN